MAGPGKRARCGRPRDRVPVSVAGPPGRRRRRRAGAAGTTARYEELKKAQGRKARRARAAAAQARGYAKKGAGRETDWVLESLVPVVEGRLPLVHARRHRVRHPRRRRLRRSRRREDRDQRRAGSRARRVAPRAEEHPGHLRTGADAAAPRGREPCGAARGGGAAGESAGVKVAFATGDANNARLLPYHAAHGRGVGAAARRGDQGDDHQRR